MAFFSVFLGKHLYFSLIEAENTIWWILTVGVIPMYNPMQNKIQDIGLTLEKCLLALSNELPQFLPKRELFSDFYHHRLGFPILVDFIETESYSAFVYLGIHGFLFLFLFVCLFAE